jgi:tRNA 2-thiocytidine biosynthesis protein TtcA
MTTLNLKSPLAESIRRDITRGIIDYSMIAPGDKILVAVSGGKDSSILAILLHEIRRIAPFDFSVDALMIDQKQPGFNPADYVRFMADNGIELTVLSEDTYSIVKDKVPDGKSYCSLCSRFRRGILYTYAKNNGYDKIALGHHRDDLIETLLLNLFYAGRIAAMPPKLRSNDGNNILIRPMSYVAERDIIDLSLEWKIPVIPCGLCGSQDGLKRDHMRDLIDELEKNTPDVRASMLHALSTIRPSQLMDKKLWDFDKMEMDKSDKE